MSWELPSYPIRAVHLVAVWAYAVAQPTFSMLESNPDFLAVRGLTRAEVLVFAASMAVVPPLLAVAFEWLVSLGWPSGANVLHVLLLFAFLIPLAMQLVDQLDPRTADMAMLLVWVISAAGAAVYVLWRPVRLFLAFSLVLPVVGIASFVLGVPVATDDAEAAPVRATSRPPIVMVVLDELPVSSLMTRAGGIDAVRYPNFARLARDGTWYRSATTVHDFSSEAVPAILTGRTSHEGEHPTFADHPRNLFTLLGGTYELRVHEAWTRLCPLNLCPRDFRTTLRSVDDLYEDVGIAYLHKVVPRSLATSIPPTFQGYDGEGFDQFIDEFAVAEGAGALHFAHLLLPHYPWRLLPSGHSYPYSETDGRRDHGDIPGGGWADNPSVAAQAYQQHLLQVGYADSVIGRLVRELERDGVYDRALVIVVADHGVSIRAGGVRRGVTRGNIGDIAAVPMFIKYPYQRRGGADARRARTIDLLPTIADALGVRIPWSVDGRSLLRPTSGEGDVVVLGLRGAVRATAADVAQGIEGTVRDKAGLFGEGRDSLFVIGSHRELLGRRIPKATRRAATTRVQVRGKEAFSDVRRGSSVVPARITGQVIAGALPRGTALAVGLNGRVVAVGVSGGGGVFRVLVPETAFREGYNRVDVFAVDVRGSKPTLVWLGPAWEDGTR